MKTRVMLVLLLLALLIVTPLAYAKEGGDQYPHGAENWMAGALPPNGFYFLNYFGYYHGELRDGSGKKVVLGGTTPSVDAEFDALRFIHVTPFKLFGADYGMHVIVPLVHQAVDLGGSNSKFSVGDIILSPVVFGWHRKQWHAVAAVDFMLPVGHFDKTDPRVSVGANYYSFEPVLALTYLSASKWELSTKLMYNIKTTNQDTNYHSGQEFHMDYAMGKHIRGWSVGATGYFLEQVSDDRVNGQILGAVPGLWDTGRRGQVFAIGPSISYTNKRHMMFIGQWQHETLVQNRFSGDKLWFKMIIPTGLFAKKKS